MLIQRKERLAKLLQSKKISNGENTIFKKATTEARLMLVGLLYFISFDSSTSLPIKIGTRQDDIKKGYRNNPV